MTNTLRRKGRLDIGSSKPANDDTVVKKRKPQTSPVTRRKPHLIRNPGGAATPKGLLLFYQSVAIQLLTLRF